MRRVISYFLFLTILFSILLTPSPLKADGVILPPDYYPVYETKQKALIIYKDNKEDLVISISFNGQASDFGWVIPLPNQPEISKVDSSIFRELSEYTQPKQNLLEKIRGEGGYYPMYTDLELAAPMAGEKAETTVEVIEEKSIGIFDYAILKAQDPEDLKDWMEENGYNLPSEDKEEYILHEFEEEPEETESETLKTQVQLWSDALPIFQDYIDSEWYFVTVKVSNKFKESTGVETQLESGAVDPLRFSFETTDMIYPMRLTSLSKSTVDVIVYVIDDHKVRVENYNYDYCSADEEDCSYFNIRYAGEIKKEDIDDMTKEIGKGSWFTADNDMYITKLYASYLSYQNMEEDVLFEDTKDNQGVNNGSMTLGEWIQLPFVLAIYLPYYILGGFFDLIDTDYYWSYGLGTAWLIVISLILFIGGTIWIVVSSLILKKTIKRSKRILLYLLQFPSVWLVSSFLGLLAVIPFAIVVGILAQNTGVTLIDSFCCFSLMTALLPLLFYRLLWRKGQKKKDKKK